MDELGAIGNFWLTTLAWVAGLTVVFGILVRLMPCNPGMYWWKDLRGVGTDIMYWFAVPLLLRWGRLLMLIFGVALLYGGKDPDLLPVKRLPLWLQAVAILLIQDVILYVSHRFFHTRLAWKFHAIHHSPAVLDWLSAARFHPINNLLSFSLADIAVLLLGFSPAALFLLMPFNLIYSAMVHANLNWTFGPLRYVFASPVFHRWHHTTRAEGLNKNFASTFPILDVLFGTFYMPVSELPEAFGTGELDFPADFWGQLIHPFCRTNPYAEPTPPVGTLERPWKWAQHHPIAAVMGLCGLGVLGFLGKGLLTNPSETPTEQPFRASAAAERALQQAQLVHHQHQLQQVLRACAENDLVRATALLDGLADAEEPTWDQQYLRDLCRRKCLVLRGHTGPVLCVALSADGRRVVSGGADGTVKIWDAVTGQETQTLPTDGVADVCLSADGQRLIWGGRDGTVQVWDAGRLFKLSGHAAAVLSVAVSANGQRIASGSADTTAKLWDAGWGQYEGTLQGQAGAVTSVALSADGRHLVAASWRTAVVCDTESGREEQRLRGHVDLVTCVAISPDGRRVATGGQDQTVMVWDVASGRMLMQTKQAGPVTSVAVSADGRRLLSGSQDRTVKLCDIATGQELFTLKGHTAAVTGVALSADGRRIVSASRDGTIAVWNAEQCDSSFRAPRLSAKR